MRETRNRRVPENVLTSLAIPFVGQVLSVGDARRVWSAKRRPTSFRVSGSRRRTCVRGERDLARWPRNLFTRRQPRAAIDDHPAWHAFIRDDVEREAVTVSVEAILSRPIATAWSTSHRELNFVTLSFPVAAEFGPAFAL